MTVPVPGYAELDLLTNFSFLEGGSNAEELVLQAQSLGLAAIGVADRNTLAGVVRAHTAARKAGFKILIGCRLTFLDGQELIVYPKDRPAYGRLCRLLSIGKSGIEAGPENLPPLWGKEGAAPQAWEDGGVRRDSAANSNENSKAGATPHPPMAAPWAPRRTHASDPTRGEGKEDRIPKAETRLTFEQAAELGEGMIALARAPEVIDEAFETRLAAWRKAWPDDLYLAAAPLHRGDDRARLAQLAQIANRTGAPMVAVNAVRYHHYDRRPLQDVLTCIREGVTIDEAGLKLAAHAEAFLKPPTEMARLFRGYEDAVARTLEIAGAAAFSLDELKYVYPDEPVPPGKTAQGHLEDLTAEGARVRFPDGVPPDIAETIAKELRLIGKVGYAPYFLTVHDIVQWARGQAILCQGRGSAANSVVCYCLGITSVDPREQDVLFERFISEERTEPPDIDVDFEHERREEVIQYVYRRYGRHRAAICATVIHYRPRSAIRDVGKALGLTEDVTGALANTVWGSYGSGVEDEHVDATGLRREDPRLKLALDLTAQLIKFPRHLSQHVGGFILTQGPLVETVPVGNGAMEDRTFIEWDKDDIDELKIMKVDVLALGMLTAIRKAFDMIDGTYGKRYDLVSTPKADPKVYDMLCEADSLGVFQVESRAQMSMLPRLRPREFYDLVVEVAIVRPGPIQGNMVHPYLNKRSEKREAERLGLPFKLEFPSPAPGEGPPDELEQVLKKTMGVPLFQEQAMRIAMVAAEFTGSEANGLRRAMATFRHNGTIGDYEEMLVGRMVKRGYDPEFAQNCYKQISGFGDYGFPESHAAAFAQLVYISSWLKRWYPEAFAAALLNSQPMGFYSPAQIVRDAREHGVSVHHPDVNASDWNSGLEPHLLFEAASRVGRPLPAKWGANHDLGDDMEYRGGLPRQALRLGLRQVDGFREEWAKTIQWARIMGGPFGSIDDLRARVGLPAAALDALAAADALNSLGLDRRPGLWAAKGLPRTAPAPLFEAADLDEADGAPPLALPATELSEEVVHDYGTIRLSLKAHPLRFLRERLAGVGVIPAKAVDKVPDDRRTAVAGVVLVRQRPGSAKGVVFLTLEDETGVTNVVVWPKVFEKYRSVVMGARMLLVRGKVQRADDSDGRVTHLVAEVVEDRTGDLTLLSDAALTPQRSPADGPTSASPERGETAYRHRHPRDVRVLPPSRDFH